MTLAQDSAQRALQHVSTRCTGIGGVQPHSVRTDCPFALMKYQHSWQENLKDNEGRLSQMSSYNQCMTA